MQVNRATQAEEDNLEMQVRASNMVRAGESLMKLVSDLKIYLILNDFPNVNEAISSNSRMFKDMQVKLLLVTKCQNIYIEDSYQVNFPTQHVFRKDFSSTLY